MAAGEGEEVWRGGRARSTNKGGRKGGKREIHATTILSQHGQRKKRVLSGGGRWGRRPEDK